MSDNTDNGELSNGLSYDKDPDVSLGFVKNPFQEKDELVKLHFGGMSGIGKVLLNRSNKEILEELRNEILKETDNLLGNELLLTSRNEIRDASAIAVKRGEILEKAMRIIMTMIEAEKAAGVVDIESPEVMVIFKYFMKKVNDTIDGNKMGNEFKDVFFRALADNLTDWKKELKSEFKEKGLQSK